MILPEGYALEARTPEVDECLSLRAVSGLSPRSREAAERGLPNTLFGVVISHDGTAIGMGRIVGDGGGTFVIVDIAVDPSHQKRGLGKAIMDALHAWLEANAPDSAHVSLIADGHARHLYAQYGFVDVGPKSIGMHYVKQSR